MDEKQAKALGKMLRDRREELGLSLRQLTKQVNIPDATIVRIEQGAFSAPAPDKLARLADALGLKLADVFALADYTAPTELPTLKPYLRTKYRGLPQDDVDAIEKYAARLAKKHGIHLTGPAPGQDES